uniref:p22 n=1 Tax=Tomato chlorosis virus TaxID=67754 RepID=A0A2I6PCP2_9CLOS|nr:p22 [Tomato chlorosis virus]
MDLTGCLRKLRQCDRLLERLGNDVSEVHLRAILIDLDECSECLMLCEQEYIRDTDCLMSFLLALKHYEIKFHMDMLNMIYDFNLKTSQLIQDVFRIKVIIRVYLELCEIDPLLAMTEACQDILESGILNIGFISSALGHEPNILITILSMVDFTVVIDDRPLVFIPSKIRFVGDKLGSGHFRWFDKFFFGSDI